MLTSCRYCGRIHDTKYDCGKKPAKIKRDTKAQHIRSTFAWQKLREQIRERDNNLCQLCIRNYEGTERTYEYRNLSVHHIISIETNENEAFSADNLITLCRTHHDMAEEGRVSIELLKEIARTANTEISPLLK